MQLSGRWTTSTGASAPRDSRQSTRPTLSGAHEPLARAVARRHAIVSGDFAPVSAVLAELADELRRCEDWQVLSQAAEVPVAGDQECALADGQGEEVVVVRIGRADRGGVGGVLGEHSVIADPADEDGSVLGRDPFPELLVSERARELGDQQF